MDNCQLNKNPKQQMFYSGEGQSHGDDNVGKPRKTHRHTQIYFEGC